MLLGVYSLICSWFAGKFERASLISLKQPYIDDNLKRPLDWIKENISEEERIISWWYYGNKINGYTQRDVCITSPSENIENIVKMKWVQDQTELAPNRDARDVAQALLAVDIQETAQLIRSLDAEYIFIHKDDVSSLEELFIAARKPFDNTQGIDQIKGSFIDKALNKESLNGFELKYHDEYAVIYRVV